VGVGGDRAWLVGSLVLAGLGGGPAVVHLNGQGAEVGGCCAGVQQHVEAAGEDLGAATVAVGGSWGSYATGGGVGQGFDVEAGQAAFGGRSQAGDVLGGGGLGQGDPDVPATGRAGGADDVCDAQLVEQAGQGFGVSLRAVGGGGGVEVEADQPPGAGLISEVDRPWLRWSLLGETARGGVAVQGPAVGIRDRDTARVAGR